MAPTKHQHPKDQEPEGENERPADLVGSAGPRQIRVANATRVCVWVAETITDQVADNYKEVV